MIVPGEENESLITDRTIEEERVKRHESTIRQERVTYRDSTIHRERVKRLESTIKEERIIDIVYHNVVYYVYGTAAQSV